MVQTQMGVRVAGFYHGNLREPFLMTLLQRLWGRIFMDTRHQWASAMQSARQLHSTALEFTNVVSNERPIGPFMMVWPGTGDDAGNRKIFQPNCDKHGLRVDDAALVYPHDHALGVHHPVGSMLSILMLGACLLIDCKNFSYGLWAWKRIS